MYRLPEELLHLFKTDCYCPCGTRNIYYFRRKFYSNCPYCGGKNVIKYAEIRPSKVLTGTHKRIINEYVAGFTKQPLMTRILNWLFKL